MKTIAQDRLPLIEFGEQLLDTNDLDPVYVILHHAEFDRALLERWLLAYWCFYHAGTASWIVDGAYWERMTEAAASKDYPRCHERRHFRGQLALKSVAYLESVGVDTLFKPLIHPPSRPVTVEYITNEVKKWYGFGDWIAFKVADMLERLELSSVLFYNADAFLFDSPRDGAALAVSHYTTDTFTDSSEWPTTLKNSWTTAYVLNELGMWYAPPQYDRRINAQEVETILCKWKSHMGGHYTVGEDIESLKKGLNRFPNMPTAKRLLSAGKAGELW